MTNSYSRDTWYLLLLFFKYFFFLKKILFHLGMKIFGNVFFDIDRVIGLTLFAPKCECSNTYMNSWKCDSFDCLDIVIIRLQSVTLLYIFNPLHSIECYRLKEILKKLFLKNSDVRSRFKFWTTLCYNIKE